MQPNEGTFRLRVPCKDAEMPAITLNEIAGWVGGRIVGDPSLLIHDALPLQDASSNCITLADNAKYADKIESSPALAPRF